MSDPLGARPFSLSSTQLGLDLCKDLAEAGYALRGVKKNPANDAIARTVLGAEYMFQYMLAKGALEIYLSVLWHAIDL